MTEIHVWLQKISIHTAQVRGVLKTKIFKRMYEHNWISGGVGLKPQKPSVEGVWIFSGITQ